eukprot:TRINITY_DN44114_c0_g1_i1.p2 TRINITY_DN44114_c0_g1~~TRINITY_DN44114_c0_g1_i1.p2  ORF type:complete len:100 (-),score=7.69 TRINITY_DN44114_c0_g1_i1:307-606(-)
MLAGLAPCFSAVPLCYQGHAKASTLVRHTAIFELIPLAVANAQYTTVQGNCQCKIENTYSPNFARRAVGCVDLLDLPQLWRSTPVLTSTTPMEMEMLRE